MAIDEFELIDRYFCRETGAGVVLGIGDDGALLDVPSGQQLVAVVDTSVAGVHFPSGLDPADIGYRSVAVNLSDLAAMGAKPAWMTLALTLPASEPAWLEAFANGLFVAADEHGVALVGGDTTRGSQIVVSVQLLGLLPANTGLLRSGCQPGDGIYVSGTLGDAAAGLSLIQQAAAENELTARFRRPSARVQLGQAVNGIASAGIDISDGLFADLQRIVVASGVGATIERSLLPVSAALVDFAGEESARRFALEGGDDYELCLTVPVAKDAEFRQVAAGLGVAVTRIGSADNVAGLRLTDGGRVVEYSSAGYRHFSSQDTAQHD
ncbi:thiamine-phosphate kinase [Woeseia oceani]|uniref:Thiamine-monophosphate kinase n=1 Tax=Woeseia oceani TaxID=1548547 RepID=A0A193LKG5_9GAMM|nr:thiamine-phosphate kinase [Woeseia oceani]ANO53050.1 thiamine-phosphate kinase [Woeseia oceani]